MNSTLIAMSAAKDRTAQIVASAPHWVAPLRNSDTVCVDTAGVAHCRNSTCWDKCKLADFTTLIDAMFNGHLCPRCHPRTEDR